MYKITLHVWRILVPNLLTPTDFSKLRDIPVCHALLVLNSRHIPYALQNTLGLVNELFYSQSTSPGVANMTYERLWKSKNETKSKHFILFSKIMNILTPCKDAFSFDLLVVRLYSKDTLCGEKNAVIKMQHKSREK